MNLEKINEYIEYLTNDKSSSEKIARILSEEYKINLYDCQEIKGSSGKTLVLIYDDIVIKIFPTIQKINDEVEVLLNVRSYYIIKLIGYNLEHNFIIYEKIQDWDELNENKLSFDKFYLKICSVACALYDMHHKGYKHGDVFAGNIGINNKGNFVLYDLESAKKMPSEKNVTESEEMYWDVLNFLEDCIVRKYNNDQIQTLVKTLLNILRSDKYIETTLVEVISMGKMVKRSLKKYVYEADDFVKLLVLLQT